jgi:acetolactate synthase-1/2/3 large subunit
MAALLPSDRVENGAAASTVTVVNNNGCPAQGCATQYRLRGHVKPQDGVMHSNTDFARGAQSPDCFGVTAEKPRNRKAFMHLWIFPDDGTEFASQAARPWMPK